MEMVFYIAEWTQLKYDFGSWEGLFLEHNTHTPLYGTRKEKSWIISVEVLISPTRVLKRECHTVGKRKCSGTYERNRLINPTSGASWEGRFLWKRQQCWGK